MSVDGQGIKCRRNRPIAENFNRLSKAHERYRRQTDGRATANSEHEREFAKNEHVMANITLCAQCYLERNS